MQTSSQIRTLGERQGDEPELRSIEINSRERSLREEARHAFDSAKQTDAVHSPEVGPAAQREALKMYAVPLKIAQRFATKAGGLMEREGRLARVEETLRSNAARLAHERAAVVETEKQLEAQRLELGQLRERHETESVRLRKENDAALMSLAARESELGVKGQEVEARIRELESRRSQAEQEAQATLARLNETSQKLAVKEAEVAAATRDLEARVARMAESEKEAAKVATDLQSRKAELDRESARLANLAEQLMRKQKPMQTQPAISAAKLANKSRKEPTLATELDLADGAMEDVPIRSRFRGPGVRAVQYVAVDTLMDRVILYILAALLAAGVLIWLARIRAP